MQWAAARSEGPGATGRLGLAGRGLALQGGSAHELADALAAEVSARVCEALSSALASLDVLFGEDALPPVL